MKHCYKCGMDKALEDFPRHKNKPSGRGSWCLVCMKEYGRTPKGKANQKRSRDNRSPEKRASLKEYHRAWRARPGNKERWKAYCDKYLSKVAHTKEFKLRAIKSTIKSKYGVTSDTYDRMFSEQGGKCAICGEDKLLNIDHCHATNTVRGLLCGTCNRGLAMFHDDADMLYNASLYIRPNPALRIA